MAVSNEIKLIINAQVTKAVANLSKAEKAVDKLGKTTKKSTSVMDKFKDGWQGAALAVGGAALI